MRGSISRLAIVFLLVFPAGSIAAETLRAGGTGTAFGMLQQVGAKFSASGGSTLNIVPGLGSGGALHALVDGVIDVAVSARPLTTQETATGLRQVAVFRTAFVLVTSQRNPSPLKRADLPRIYTAASPSWADGTPIRVVLRPRSETDTALLGDLSAGMNEAIEAARLRAEVPVAPTDQDNVALAKDAPGSLASSTTTQLKTERVQLQIVPLDDLKPTLANVQSGAYPYVKMLYVVIRANGQASAQGFVDFLRSPLGLAALREAEILPDGE